MTLATRPIPCQRHAGHGPAGKAHDQGELAHRSRPRQRRRQRTRPAGHPAPAPAAVPSPGTQAVRWPQCQARGRSTPATANCKNTRPGRAWASITARPTTPAVHAPVGQPVSASAAAPSPGAQAMTLATRPVPVSSTPATGLLGKHTTRACLRINHGQGAAAGNARGRQATRPGNGRSTVIRCSSQTLAATPSTWPLHPGHGPAGKAHDRGESAHRSRPRQRTRPAGHPAPAPVAEPSPGAQARRRAATPSAWPQHAGHGKLGKYTTRACLRIDHGEGSDAGNACCRQATPPRLRP
ncbi:hypothetical protein AAKU55_004798 [Oxalobacteraceae bacterium GrIS 1.11]